MEQLSKRGACTRALLFCVKGEKTMEQKTLNIQMELFMMIFGITMSAFGLGSIVVRTAIAEHNYKKVNKEVQ